jgi:hypothetical protein
MSAHDGGHIKTVSGQIVCPVHLLDNSMKTLLIDPTATVQDVSLQMAEKLNFIDPADDSLCFSLHECRDGVTSKSVNIRLSLLLFPSAPKE